MKTSVLIFKLIAGVVYNTALFAVLLLVPAHTCDWWRAWVFIGTIFAGTAATLAGLCSRHQDLLRERFKPLLQKGQPLADKILVVLFVVSYGAVTLFVPHDVFEFHLMTKPGPFVSSCGLVLVIAGWALVALAFRENTFAAPVVKLQEDRQHAVVDTGVYAVVRHPMYAGCAPLLVGMSLWLESYPAAFLSLVPTGFLVLRIIVEEEFLTQKLPGYAAYTQKVRYRLIPFVW
ncbi:MAG: isoprenylcysteine carboxylmethyltransferase family protein [Verrucomicrobiia bacterium]